MVKKFFNKFRNFINSLSLSKASILWILNTTVWINFWVLLVLFIYIRNNVETQYIQETKKLLHQIINNINNEVFSPINNNLEKLSYLLKLEKLSKKDLNTISFLTSTYISYMEIKEQTKPTFININHGLETPKLIENNGKFFILYYVPVIDSENNVKGIWNIKLDLTPYLSRIKVILQNANEGYYKYFFLITQDKKIIYHPFLHGNFITEIPNKTEKQIYLKILKEESGIFHYKGSAFEIGKNELTDKILIFEHFKPFNWIISACIYKEIINKKAFKTWLNIATKIIIVITLGELIFLFIAIIWVNKISKNIKTATNIIKNIIKNRAEKIKLQQYPYKNEIGELLDALNELIIYFQDLKNFKTLIEGDETLEDVYKRLAETLKKLTKAEECIIYEISNSKNTISLVYPENIEPPCDIEIFFNADLCRVKRTSHTVNSLSFGKEILLCKYFHLFDKYYHICFPLMSEGNVGGVVHLLFDKKALSQKSEAEIDFIVQIVKEYIKEAEPVIETKRLVKVLKESALKDPLTGVFNRRFLEESYEPIVSGILRRKTVLGVLMCDIDDFKKVNDLYGHDVGDLVLKQVATKIKHSIRKSDLVIRWGGEEFLVLLMDTKKGMALEIAEKIRKNISNLEIIKGNIIIKKTISIGVSEFPIDSADFWETIKFADIALYIAKKTGKNKCVRFDKKFLEETEEEPI